MRKLFLLILLTFIVFVNSYAQKDKDLLKTVINLSTDEASVKAFLDEITGKYSIAFSYESTEIDLNRMVKLSKKSSTLENILSEIFRNTDIKFKLYANVIILAKVKTNEPTKKKVTISGIIKDSKSSETLVGAAIYSVYTKTGEAANQYGFYSLTVLQGQNKIQYSYMGYETKIVDTLIENNTRLDMELHPSNIELNEVIVTNKQNKLLDNKQGFSRIEMESVKSLPSLFGETDVLKNVLLLPGVNSTSEMGGNFQVRGGSWDQNLMLLDEAVVYNSNHLFGLYSTYNPDIIKDVKFYKSGIPANYGGRVSSVMDVTQKEGDMKSYHADCGLGLISGRLEVEGPIINDKSSFVIAARRSLFEPYMKYVNNDNAKSVRPYFYDINSKVNYIFDPNNRLYLSGYFGSDNFYVINSQNMFYGNITGTLRFNHIFNEKLFSNTSLIFSKYSMWVTTTNTFYDTVSWKSKLGLDHYEFKNDFTYILLKHKIKFGVQSIFYTFHPGEQTPVSGNVYTFTKIPDQNSLESALFLDDNIKLFRKLEMQAGVRLSNYNCIGKADVYSYMEGEPRDNAFIEDTLHYAKGKIFQTYSNLEPRVSIKYSLNDCHAITVSYNKLVQYVQLVTFTFSPQPYDMWKPSDNYIKPLSGDQFSLGWFLQLKDKGLNFSIETYYKSLKNVIEAKPGNGNPFNTNIDAAIVQGTGKAYGAEFSANIAKDGFSGMISYTRSRSLLRFNSEFLEDKINLGKTFPSDYDLPDKINATGEYHVSKRLSFSFNFIYQTGRPLSLPSGQFYYLNNLMSYYSGKNQFRYRPYHRLDIGAILRSKQKPNRIWKGYWAFSVYNVYDRQNDYYIGITNKNDGTRNTQATSLWIFGIVPSLSYNIKF